MSAAFVPCEELIHGALTGENNMDIDAEMLTSAVHGSATIRTYQWSEPTVSLGHFQVTSTVDVPERFKELAVVKRLSGGGAILHDRELTYSLALPKTHPLCATPSRIYNEVHECIIDILSEYGIRSQMRGDAAFAEKPFLCFERGDERDIVIGQNKIVGSAQRRRQGAVLQHGSILLSRSYHAPELPGIQDITNFSLDPMKLAQQIRSSVSERLHLQIEN